MISYPCRIIDKTVNLATEKNIPYNTDLVSRKFIISLLLISLSDNRQQNKSCHREKHPGQHGYLAGILFQSKAEK